MTVVALVPAFNRADSVGDTVAAVRSVDGVDEVVVVDDGSTDDTALEAGAAGAAVVALPENRGKGAAVTAGVEARPHADAYLLADADLGVTASSLGAVLEPVVAGRADMTIAVLPAAGRRGGFGTVARLSRWATGRLVGFRPRSPLSGQRAVEGGLLRSLLPLADRFGLETGLTIDARRRGARVAEVEVALEHRHRGRSLGGFRHRAAQGADVMRALWPRSTSRRFRMGVIVMATAAALAWALWSGEQWEPASEPLADDVGTVVVFGLPYVGVEDLDQGLTPNLERLMEQGAGAAMTVRTASARPTTAEAYTSLGASAQLRGSVEAGRVYAAVDPLEAGTAGAAVARRTGRSVDGDLVALGGIAQVRLNTGRQVASQPGKLGEALREAGLRTALVANADNVGSNDDRYPPLHRPAAMAIMDGAMSIGTGSVGPELLMPDPAAPFGHRADADAVLRASLAAIDAADVVVIDPGDLDRANAFRRLALDRPGQRHWEDAVRRTDALLGRVAARLPDDALLLVAAVAPPPTGWHLTPVAAVGPGIDEGRLYSPATKRPEVVTLTDLAPTVLHALDVPVPAEMIGQPLRVTGGDNDIGSLQSLVRLASVREVVYFPTIVGFIIAQALLYAAVVVVLRRRGDGRRPAHVMRLAVLAVAAFPLSTFLLRAVPGHERLGPAVVVLLLAIVAAVVAVASRARRHRLSPLAWLVGATAVLLAVDVATGARLQMSSIHGYSYFTAARFYGIGNAAFAMMAACALLAACIHVQFAPRRREAVVTAAGFLLWIAVVNGAPTLGNDVGGILTLVPAFALTVYVLSGRRLTWRAVALAGAAAVALLVAAAAIDLLRPVETRTHLGRLVTDVEGGGGGLLTTTLARKLATNLRVLTLTVWVWMVPIITLFGIYLVAWEGLWSNLMPPGSALRAGMVGVLATGLLGFAVNDSGVLITAIVFVYVGPYLTLLALHGRGTAAGDVQRAPPPTPVPATTGVP